MQSGRMVIPTGLATNLATIPWLSPEPSRRKPLVIFSLRQDAVIQCGGRSPRGGRPPPPQRHQPDDGKCDGEHRRGCRDHTCSAVREGPRQPVGLVQPQELLVRAVVGVGVGVVPPGECGEEGFRRLRQRFLGPIQGLLADVALGQARVRGADLAELEIRVVYRGVSVLLAQFLRESRIPLARPSLDARCIFRLIQWESCVKPTHVGKNVIPQRHDEDHAPLHGFPHPLEAALLRKVVGVVKGFLVGFAILVRDRVRALLCDGRH
mmetsp:Transcript_124497/g.352446  ORF Transcript_124497/g.352446 Transcript_124497/m.352446 type:complete len:265 (-) Transcript_124497:200-994(-)